MEERVTERYSSTDYQSPLNSEYSDDTIVSKTKTIVIPNGYDADGSSGSATPMSWKNDLAIVEEGIECFDFEAGTENTNNNVIRGPLTASRSASEVFTGDKAASLLHQNRQSRKGRMSKSASHSVTKSHAKLQQRNFSKFKHYHLARMSKSCTIACDIMRPDYKKPHTSVDEDDSDTNIYYTNFTSGSISISDFSQNSDSVSSRSFDDDDDDDYNDDENHEDDNGDNESQEMCSINNYSDVNEDSRKNNSTESSNHEICKPGTASDKEVVTCMAKIDPRQETCREDDSENGFAVPYSSLASGGIDESAEGEVSKALSEVNAAARKSPPPFNNYLTKTKERCGNGSFPDIFKERGDNENRTNELCNTGMNKSATNSKIVEISLDGVTSEKLDEPANLRPITIETVQMYQGEIRQKSKSHSDLITSKNRDIGESHVTNTNILYTEASRGESDTIPLSPTNKARENMRKSNSNPESKASPEPEEDVMIDNTSSPSAMTSTNSDKILMTPCQSMHQSPDSVPTMCNKRKGGARRPPLPQELADAIQRAVANGDLGDVDSVEVDGNGYLLRYVCNEEESEAVGKECFLECSERETVKGNCEEKGKEEKSGIKAITSMTTTSKNSKSDGKLLLSKSDVKVLSFKEKPNSITKEKECVTCQRIEHNDIFHLGRKVDVMPDSGSSSPTASSLIEVKRRDPKAGHNGKSSNFPRNNQQEVKDEVDRMENSMQPVTRKSPSKHELNWKVANKDRIKTDNSCASTRSNKNGDDDQDIKLQNPNHYNVDYVQENDYIGEINYSPPQDWQHIEEYKIDCMAPMINDEACGDFLTGLCGEKKSASTENAYNRVDESDDAKFDTNGNKLVNNSSSCENEEGNVNGEDDAYVHGSPRHNDDTQLDVNGAESKVLETNMIKSVPTAKGEGIMKARGNGPNSKTKFLSLLLNMMDDDKGKKETQQTSAPSKKRKDEQGSSNLEEPEAESSEKSFPRGVDSIEPNDKTWWSCAKEDMELSNKQAWRARRRLLMRRHRLCRGKKILGSHEHAQSDRSVSPENTSRDECNSEDSCNLMMSPNGPNKELKKYIAKMKLHLDNGMEGVYNEDQVKTYAKAAESFVRPNRYGECECDEDGSAWMSEGRTPFSQEGDMYSVLEDYYSRRSDCTYTKSWRNAGNVPETECDQSALSNESRKDKTVGGERNTNSARISKRKILAPSVMAPETLKKLSLDDGEDTMKQYRNRGRVAMWNYPKVENYMCEGLDSLVSTSQGAHEFYKTRWRSRRPQNTATTNFSKNKDVNLSLQTRLQYTDLLHIKARDEIDFLRKIDEERVSVRKSIGVTNANREQHAKKTNKQENVKVVRFSDVGVKTLKNNENQWNSTVNEMLLKSEKVQKGGDSESLNERSGPRYPRSESAKKVSAVPEKTFNFLNKLLEQDMQEQQMSCVREIHFNDEDRGEGETSKYNDPKTHLGELQLGKVKGKQNLPPIYYNKSCSVLSQRSWSELVSRPLFAQTQHGSHFSSRSQQHLSEHNQFRSPVSTSSTSVKPISPRVGRRSGSSLSDRGRRRKTTKIVEKCSQNKIQSVDTKEEVRRRNNSMIKNTMKRKHIPSVPTSENFQLGLYSDLFNYYVSPYLRDRSDSSIVQMYQK